MHAPCVQLDAPSVMTKFSAKDASQDSLYREQVRHHNVSNATHHVQHVSSRLLTAKHVLQVTPDSDGIVSLITTPNII